MRAYKLDVYYCGERSPHSTDYFSSKPPIEVLSKVVKEAVDKDYTDDIAINLVLNGVYKAKYFDCWLEEIDLIEVVEEGNNDSSSSV